MAEGLLDAAIAWAGRGFRVFPLIPGDNRPREKGWTRTATRDPDEVRRLWSDPVTGWPQDFNIGVLTDEMIVVDVDVKGGRKGLESAEQLGLLADVLDTLTVRTPSGGLHIYYHGPNRSLSVGKLGEGLDIRSYHGYVVAPGSVTPKGVYRLENDAAPIRVPPALLSRLDAPRERQETAPVVDLDLEASIVAAVEFLKWRPGAEAGALNDTCFRVAAAVKDYGVSEKKAVELIVEHWTEKCRPPIPADEVAGIVANAYAYGTRPPGVSAPAAEFGSVKVEEPDVFSVTADSVVNHITFRPLPEEIAIPPRPWIAPRLLMRGAVTVLAAPGGAGKSTLQLATAAHCWLARPFAGFDFRTKTKVLVINNEDDRDEMARRLRAICKVYDLDPAAVAEGVALLSGADFVFKIADASPPKFRTDEIAKLGEFCREHGIGVLAIDPFVETHDSSEVDEQAMKAVMAAYRGFARDYGVAVLLAHHTPKGGQGGSQDAIRGSTAIVNSARIAYTLFEANAEDGLRYRIPPAKLNGYVRLDEVKANLSLRSGRPTWFRRVPVVLRSGDEVGVLAPVDIEKEAAVTPADIAREVRNYMHGENSAEVNAHELAKHLVTVPGWDLSVFGGSSVTHIKEKIAELFAQPFVFDDGETLHTKAGKNKTGWTLVLE